ncbi:hypothetical protein [Geodermatophilus poikilotrophus]|uniref:Cysteine dioxygenase type I n=1 Tax=Geodermatophilus poikilotrophus TaxID=1333667 RepID=A0A1H9ZMK7_9ACTN|nr:hypothetical protein [Geodermatophilus poikilotrophus]SES82853.1 Cysteine dioxygenase type I [Geodermatophilus poikilotrophus]
MPRSLPSPAALRREPLERAAPPRRRRRCLDPSLHEDLSHAQVWLLPWLPGQGTGLHDHGGSAGASAVVRGTPRLTVMNTYRVQGRGLVRTGTEEAGVDW